MTNSETVGKTEKTNDLLSDSNNANSKSFRTIVGEGMNSFSALINDNIIAARYGIFASIALFTVSSQNSRNVAISFLIPFVALSDRMITDIWYHHINLRYPLTLKTSLLSLLSLW